MKLKASSYANATGTWKLKQGGLHDYAEAMS
jgi:hypothetical protein